MSTVADELNTPQAQAVVHVQGPLVVFAGAGSGKTRVITYRIANLVAMEHVAPYRILAVTFTNKAAQEMRTRLERLVGEALARELWVGTFHAVCARILRRHGSSVGVPPNFVIYDTTDQRTVVNRALKELELDEKRYPPRAMLSRIMKEKQEGRGPDEMSVDSYMDEAVLKIFKRYEATLLAAGAVDFEDLIVRTRKLLKDEKNPDGQRLRRRFDHVLVDEFQDTNFVQYDLLKLLASESRNLCVVGDDDQSIYRWRGADRRNILGFRRDFPDAQIVKLEQNYRSTGNIVRAALAVIESAREREPKELWTENVVGDALDVVAARDEHDEASFVVKSIAQARESGVELREIAVFYRVHAQSRVLEESLRGARVPYRIVGGTKFFERAEIKDALSYLRILVNSKSDVDLLRIVNNPPRGIGATTMDRLGVFATARGISLHEALALADMVPELGTAAKKKLSAVSDLLARMLRETADKLPSETLIHVLDATGYSDALRAERSVEAESRLENLAELVGSLRDYESEATAAGEVASLPGFLERVTLRGADDAQDETGAVTLMTVHAAKGLEFDTVFLTGMEEDMFPYRSMEGGDAEDFEEERRLAYVAITRARRRLVLTHAQMRQIFGQTRWGRPSRFLQELPPDSCIQRTTSGASAATRFIDRPSFVPQGGFRHPQAAPPMPRPPPKPDEVGGRYVDRDFFSDDSSAGDEGFSELRRGSRVWHERFGEGLVRDVVQANEPAVVAHFPGWGEKKVLLRFLREGPPRRS